MNLRFIKDLPQPAKLLSGGGMGREVWEVWANGPGSYSQSTGDPVYGPAVGEHMSAPCGSVLTQSGDYEVIFQPAATNTLRPGWVARWRFAVIGGTSGVASVAASGSPTGMTPGTYPLAFSGGGGSGAAGTITVTTDSVTNITITDPGTDYTSVPTVSAATGGTPPTLTATLATAGQEVASGTDLSAETIQLAAVGGSF